MNESLFTSNRHDWQTPRSLFDPLNQEFAFTIDAAATSANAMLPRFWTIQDNALAQDWKRERVWCNPPYGREQKAFIVKAAQLEAIITVLLLPARPDTAVWHDYIFPLAEVRFLRGRVRFVGGKSAAPFPSALAIFRRSPSPRAVIRYTYTDVV